MLVIILFSVTSTIIANHYRQLLSPLLPSIISPSLLSTSLLLAIIAFVAIKCYQLLSPSLLLIITAIT
jgi:hypothetical protein